MKASLGKPSSEQSEMRKMPLLGSTYRPHHWGPKGDRKRHHPFRGAQRAPQYAWSLFGSNHSQKENICGLQWDEGRLPEAHCGVNTERNQGWENKGPCSPEGCATRFKNKTYKQGELACPGPRKSQPLPERGSKQQTTSPRQPGNAAAGARPTAQPQENRSA